MQISVNTINVLKNFSSINPSIIINEGNVIETISNMKTVKAKAKVDTTFPRRFAMYNLNKLISILSLYDNADVRFEDNNLVISDGDNKITNLTYSDESTIIKPPKTINLPSVDVSVSVTNENIKDVEKALGVLSVRNIIISGDGEFVYLQAADGGNPSGDVYSIKLGMSEKKFKAVFKAENIKVLPGNYTIEISSKGISRFYNDDVEYFIAVESELSKF